MSKGVPSPTKNVQKNLVLIFLSFLFSSISGKRTTSGFEKNFVRFAFFRKKASKIAESQSWCGIDKCEEFLKKTSQPHEY